MTASAPYAKEQRVQVDPTQPLNCSLRTWPPPSRQFFTTTTCLPNAHSKWSKILLQKKKERKRSLEKQSKTPELLASEFNFHMSSKPNRKNFAHFRYKIILLLKKNNDLRHNKSLSFKSQLYYSKTYFFEMFIKSYVQRTTSEFLFQWMYRDQKNRWQHCIITLENKAKAPSIIKSMMISMPNRRFLLNKLLKFLLFSNYQHIIK